MTRSLNSVRRFRRVSTILDRLGFDSVETLHDAYVLPGVVKGVACVPGTNIPLAAEPRGKRGNVYKLANGYVVQEHNLKVLDAPAAIPGVVCREGHGTDDDRRALSRYCTELAAACRAHERARADCGFPERPADQLEVPFAVAAEAMGVARSTVSRAAEQAARRAKMTVVERKAKHGDKTYKAIVLTLEDGESLEYDIEQTLEKFRELDAKMRARHARFATIEP